MGFREIRTGHERSRQDKGDPLAGVSPRNFSNIHQRKYDACTFAAWLDETSMKRLRDASLTLTYCFRFDNGRTASFEVSPARESGRFIPPRG